MATVGLKYIVLVDNWPGTPDPNLGKPTNGWDNTTDCCVTAPTYDVGTKIAWYNDATENPGASIMCYMARHDASWDEDHGATTGGLAAGDVSDNGLICTHMDTTTIDGNESYVPWYFVGADCTASDATREGIGQVAIACGSMVCGTAPTDYKFGWFWVGGVCPGTATAGDLTWLYDASMTSTVVKGRGIILADDGTNGIEFHDGSIGDSTQGMCGWSIFTAA